jgi:hypothetical protein
VVGDGQAGIHYEANTPESRLRSLVFFRSSIRLSKSVVMFLRREILRGALLLSFCLLSTAGKIP